MESGAVDPSTVVRVHCSPLETGARGAQSVLNTEPGYAVTVRFSQSPPRMATCVWTHTGFEHRGTFGLEVRLLRYPLLEPVERVDARSVATREHPQG